MKILKFSAIIIFLISCSKITAQSFKLNLEGGNNSGFTGKVGIGFSSINWDGWLGDFPFNGTGGTLQYRINRIDGKTFQGPNLQAYVYFWIFTIGANGSYLFNDGNSKFILEPEIGLTFATWLTLKYTYNLSNIDNFFPQDYNRNGLLLGLNIPLEGW